MGDKMKATFMQRLFAYFIDYLIISVVFSLFALSFNTTKLTSINDEINNTMNEIVNISSEEEQNLDDLNNKLIDLQYEYQQESKLASGISLLITFAYFTVFQFLNKGQTIGKKLLKIKVVNKEEKEPSFVTMFLRTFIVQGILTTGLSLIGILVLDKELYMETYFILNSLMSIFVVVCALMVLYRKDRRGLHDMMAGSLVVKEDVE